MAGHLAEVAAASGLAILVLMMTIALIRILRRPIKHSVGVETTGNLAIFLYIAVTAVILTSLEKSTSITLSPRMLFPLIPFVILAFADICGRLQTTLTSRPDGRRGFRWAAVAAAICLVVSALGGQFQAVEEVTEHIHRFDRVRSIVQKGIDNGSEIIVPEELLKGKRILSEEIHMLGEVLQQGVVGLTANCYTNRIWTDDEVIQLIRKYQIDRVVVFPDVQPKDENPFLESLFDEDSAASSRSWLEPVLISPQIRIYSVRESLLVTQRH